MQTVIQVLLILLWVAGTALWMAGFWAATGMIKEARESGHRYWLVNPRATIASLKGRNFGLFVAFWVAGLAVCGLAFLLAQFR
jgi:hypothetical protein